MNVCQACECEWTGGTRCPQCGAGDYSTQDPTTTLLIPAGRGAWVRTVGCPDPWQLHADTPIEINANPNATEPGQIVSARLMTLCEQAAETD